MIAIINEYSIDFANAVDEGFEGTIRENVRLHPIPDDLNNRATPRLYASCSSVLLG